MTLKIGYSFWGFLGDRKFDLDGREVSTPDGNATYSWSILHEMQARGHEVWLMQEDRDWHSVVAGYGAPLFEAFSGKRRRDAYMCCTRTFGIERPELDVLLLEWRFPIPGRNTPDDKGRPGYQPDLERQTDLLNHYMATDTKTILWDLDHKLTYQDEDMWSQAYDAIFETAVKPLDQHFHRRTRVEPPFVMDDLMQFDTEPSFPEKMAVYVGSRYERDSEVDKWIVPLSVEWPSMVELVGKWDGDASKRWPDVCFGGRIGVADFRRVYSNAVCCPLLSKPSYREAGFVTPRVWEAVLFGTLPVGLGGHLGVERYTPYVAHSPSGLCDLVRGMAGMGTRERHRAREEMAHRLGFMDVRHFVDAVEAVV